MERKLQIALLTYPVDESPIEGFLQEWKFPDHATKPPVLELSRIRRRDTSLEPPKL